MPLVARSILACADDPAFDVEDLLAVIDRDPAIVLRILKVANSPLYGFPRQVETLNHAIALLGVPAVRSLALMISMREVFTNFGLMEKLLWENASMAGPVSAEFARELEVAATSDEAFVAGLLHDIGQIALANDYPKEYGAVVARAYNEGIGFVEAETAAFGFDHAELGAEVASKWCLPELLETVIRYHHHPEALSVLAEPARQLTALIVVVSACLTRLGIGRQGPVESLDLAAMPAWSALGLGEVDVERMLEVVGREIKRTETLLV